MAVFADAGGEPGALLAQTPGGPVAQVVGWQEFALAEEDYVDVVSSDHVWIVAQADTNKSGCSPTSVANLGRRFKSAAYGDGLPDPFGTSSTFNNSVDATTGPDARGPACPRAAARGTTAAEFIRCRVLPPVTPVG